MDKKVVPYFNQAVWPGIMLKPSIEIEKLKESLKEELKKEILKEILALLKTDLTQSEPTVISIPGNDWEIV